MLVGRGAFLGNLLRTLGALALPRLGVTDCGAVPLPMTHSGGWFVDIAPRSKFAYHTNNHFTGRKYFPQPMCGGIGVIDCDNDGRMDINAPRRS